ncbi:rCG25914 [Rattus norvegicus]|uniref:RCG25914 n=1 Tax=Rattus norvegicus TaxID=10116 RepID=A6I3I9_RAT|nr:rCG25914 [Rattus norvegicus]
MTEYLIMCLNVPGSLLNSVFYISQSSSL